MRIRRRGHGIILETLLDRLATYKEKTLALKGKINKALFYPVMVILVAILITAIIMYFVIPSFKQVFTSFGADLPYPTLVVIAMSDFVVANWYWMLFGSLGAGYFGFQAWRRSPSFQRLVDRYMLKIPVIGELLQKASVARWSRTLSTTFAAGVPLVDALDSVGPASGNAVYEDATKQVQAEVNVGTSLAQSMQNTGVFPNMAVQMTSIGEESGALDSVLSKVADYYEREVDETVDALASLIEPVIMVLLGVIIGGIVVAIYLPIFKLGQVVAGIVLVPLRLLGPLPPRVMRTVSLIALASMLVCSGFDLWTTARESYFPVLDLTQPFWLVSIAFVVGVSAWTYIGFHAGRARPLSPRSRLAAGAGSAALLAAIVLSVPLSIALEVTAAGWGARNTFSRSSSAPARRGSNGPRPCCPTRSFEWRPTTSPDAMRARAGFAS